MQDALIDVLRGTDGNEGMPQNVPSFQNIPLRTANESSELLVSHHRMQRRQLGLSSLLPTEHYLPTRVLTDPLLQHRFQEPRNRYSSCGALPSILFRSRITAEQAGASDQAGRVLQRVKSIYRLAVTRERIDANPMVDLVPSEVLKPRDVTHRPAMSDGEQSFPIQV